LGYEARTLFNETKKLDGYDLIKKWYYSRGFNSWSRYQDEHLSSKRKDDYQGYLFIYIFR